MPSSLPYHDTKPVGAADFYYANNATFRFIYERLGAGALIRYWQEMGKNYFKPVSAAWVKGGLPAVARYWEDFFKAEPFPENSEGVEVRYDDNKDEVEILVKTCPAISHLRSGERKILPNFCQHCYYVSEAMAEPAGLSVRIEGGAGSCRQRFFKTQADTTPQDLALIKECK